VSRNQRIIKDVRLKFRKIVKEKCKIIVTSNVLDMFISLKTIKQLN